MHCTACAWIHIGKISFEKGVENWINEISTDPNDTFHLYIESFYYMLMTVTTIGYGSNAYSIHEVIFCIFLEIVGVVGYAALSGLLASKMSELDSQKAR